MCSVDAFSFNLADMILSIKSDINKIIENEMRLEGLKDMDFVPDKEACPSAAETNKTTMTTDRGPVSRFKIQAPQTITPPLPMENITDDELVGMTLQAIEASYRQKWTKLTDHQRKDRISSFAKKYVREKGISSENESKIYEALRLKILVEKTIKAKDFVYDEGTGIIHEILGMVYDPIKGIMTMHKKPEASTVVRKQSTIPVTQDESDSASDEISTESPELPKTEASKKSTTESGGKKTKKTPKLMKTMARLKR